MSSTSDQIERMAKELVILKVADDLKQCNSLEDFEKVRDKYVALAEEISIR